MKRADVDAWADMHECDLVVADGFDDCIVGIGQQFDKTFVVYSREAVLDKLVSGGMSYADAVEYFDFNIVGAFCGDATPCFLVREAVL
jgi:hypothetical protein